MREEIRDQISSVMRSMNTKVLCIKGGTIAKLFSHTARIVSLIRGL